jgi:hypothetical protein
MGTNRGGITGTAEDAAWEGLKIKLRYLGYLLVFLLMPAAYTVPSDEAYHRFLKQEHGIKCMVYDPDCLPGAKSAKSEHIRNVIVYMTGETKLDDGGARSAF